MARSASASSKSNPNVSGRLWALVGLSVVGLAMAVYQSYHFYDLRRGGAGFKSFCNISATMNCDAVTASRYAELLPGIPLSSFAAGWYLAIAIIALLAMAADWNRKGRLALIGMTGFSLVMTVIYFFIMAAVIHTYCPTCLGIDAVNLLSFALALSLRPRAEERGPGFALFDPVFAVVLGSLFVAIVALKGIEGEGISQQAIADQAASVLGSAPVAVNAGPEFPTIMEGMLGSTSSAPVTIVEFSDFQCPYCRLGAILMNTITSAYPGKVRLVHRNLPLSSECNPKMDRPMHPAACEAAKVVVCANKQGKFADTYHSLFENQASLAPGKPTELAQKDGHLDPAQLRDCLNSPETAAAISRDVQEATSLNINSTPTFFVNGHRIEGVFPLPVWTRIIDETLAAGAAH